MTQISARKRRKLSPPEETGLFETSTNSAVKSYLQSAAQWNLEQDYENRPRKLKGKKQNARLPIKTQDGRVEQVEHEPSASEGDGDIFLDSASDDEAQGNGSAAAAEQPPTDPRPLKEIVRSAKEEMARIAGLINEDPEEYIGRIQNIADLADSPHEAVCKLALVTQLAIFKDVIPGYRIRALDQAALLEKVSKEVRKLRAFEQSLVSSYKSYVDTLAALAKSRRDKISPRGGETAKVALSCACALVTAVPHFNFREDLLKILIHHVSRRKANEAHAKCTSTLETLFRDDEEGEASHEAVSMIARMLKARDYAADESVLNTFLHLRLLNEFAFKASAETVEGDWNKGKGKKPKQPYEFRTKRQRKALKELKAVEKEFQETDASVQREARERAQAETLKLVFGTYFRVLKTRSPQLMGAVLEGLARYAHLINQDFFGDLLVTLQELANQALAQVDAEQEEDLTQQDAESPDQQTPQHLFRTPQDALRSALLCTTTAFALLSSQEAASLNLDLSSFANTLYALLLHLSTSPDLESTSKSLRLSDVTSNGTQSRTKVNAIAHSTLLLRALTSSLTQRSTPPMRLAAFAHRLMMIALQVPEKTAVAITTLVQQLMSNQGRKIRGLWNTEEQRGDGRFEPLGSIDACKPYCGSVWEGELLRLHFAEPVRKGIAELEVLVKGLA